MKKLFPLLLSYVFLSVQAWAISGGPVFTNGDTTTTLGTFAGVLLPEGEEGDDNTGTGATALGGGNSLGVFSLGIPNVNLASGNFVYFTEGRTYVGSILGIADPDTLRFSGLVKAQFNIDINAAAIIDTDTGDVTPVNFSFPAGYANGSIDCEIFPGGLGSVNSSTSLAVRIRGSASLSVQAADVDTGQPVGAITSLSLQVDGYKQSTTADIAADLNAFGLDATTSGTGQ